MSSNPISRRAFLRMGGAGALAAAGLGSATADATSAGASSSSTLVPPSNAAEALGVLGRSGLRTPLSLPFPHLPPGRDTLPQIQHIVMLMMENHSYDNFLGTLARDSANGPADGFTMAPSAVTSWNPNGVLAGNPNGKGQYQWAFHMPTTCQHSGSPTNEWTAAHQQYDHGKLDGFVTGTTFGSSAPAGPVAMAYWNAHDLPVLYSLANSFPLADRWFCSLLGQTDANRRYVIGATSSGMTEDISISATPNPEGLLQDLALLLPGNGTIFDLLTAFGISWTSYVANGLESATAELFPLDDLLNLATMKTFNQFFTDAAAGSLPAFSFLDEDYGSASQENPQDIVVGEKMIHQVVTALADSPLWDSTLLILNYDEHGGYYDHVAPPAALAPDLIPPLVLPGQSTYDGFNRYGFRVPALVISPYARQNWVTHKVYDHTSVLAMIERKWNLPALTWRDANANDLMDFLDPVALANKAPQRFNAICPSLANPAPSLCPAKAPSLPLAGTFGSTPLPPH